MLHNLDVVVKYRIIIYVFIISGLLGGIAGIFIGIFENHLGLVLASFSVIIVCGIMFFYIKKQSKRVHHLETK